MRNKLGKLQFSVTIALVVALVLAVTMAFAIERIQGGAFDNATDVNFWTEGTAAINYVLGEGNTNPGSAGISTANTGQVFKGQCVDVSTPSPHFTFKGFAKFLPIGTQADLAGVQIAWFSSVDCSGAPVGVNGPFTVTPNAATWTEFDVIGLATPPTAQTASIRLLTSSPDGTDATVLYDDLTFYDSTSTAITLSSMDARSSTGSLLIIALAALLLSGGGLLVLRRRRLS
jgi:hypothetical protein